MMRSFKEQVVRCSINSYYSSLIQIELPHAKERTFVRVMYRLYISINMASDSTLKIHMCIYTYTCPPPTGCAQNINQTNKTN